MGLNGRGVVHARVFGRLPNVEVAYLCDVDSNVLQKSQLELGKVQQKVAKGVGDFRRMLDDKAIDAIVIATPDHWQTPATILALKAGKHVFVGEAEGHNAREAELDRGGAAAYQRVVQIARSTLPRPLREIFRRSTKRDRTRVPGARVVFDTRSRHRSRQGGAVPPHLDDELWQGPRPRHALPRQRHPLQLHCVWRGGRAKYATTAHPRSTSTAGR